jgi:hypothetical protein
VQFIGVPGSVATAAGPMNMAINPIQQGMNLDIAISFFLRTADGPADEVELFLKLLRMG